MAEPRQDKYPNLKRGGRRKTYHGVKVEPVELQKARYLAGYSVDCTLTAGCKAGGVAPATVYQWREMDDAFVLAERQCQMELADRMESEAIRRAYSGWERPIYQRGILCGYERVYSDVLLKTMLGALRPEKFKDQHLNVSGQVEQIVRQVAGFNAAEVL